VNPRKQSVAVQGAAVPPTGAAAPAPYQRYSDILESIADAFYAVDADWRVAYVNHKTEELWQHGRDEILGKSLYEIFPAFPQTPGYPYLMRAMTERVPTHCEIYSATIASWVEVSAYPAAGGGLTVYFRDVTERKLAEMERLDLQKKLAADLAAMTRLHELSMRLISAEELGSLLGEVLDAAIELQNAHFGTVQLRDAETGELEFVAQRNFGPDFLDNVNRVPGLHSAGGRALATRRRVMIQDVQRDPDYAPLRALAARAGYRAIVATPLFAHDGEPLGVLSTHFRAPYRPSEHELRLTDLYARQAAEIIGFKLGEERLRRAHEELEQRVRERTAELELRNREMDEFVYVASHDLKAPLVGIQHLAAWIQDDAGEALPPASQAHLAKLQGRVKRMDQLLNDLLAYLGASRRRHAPERVAVADLVRDCVEIVAPPPGFRVVLKQPLPVLHTERIPLATIFTNLIGNAVKHHHRPAAGHVTLAAARRGAWVEFSVADDGPGIDPAFHERIFQFFQTLRPRDQMEGSGVGLALVKMLVESRGGSVRVESAPGSGATFRFTWPAST
jgi:PAS domain S-box-containing protein